MNQEAAEAVEALARDRFEEKGYILLRIGKAPKRAILFRTDAPFKKIQEFLISPDGSKEKIELLGDGQQLIVDGIHPDTGKPYAWFGGKPTETKREDDLRRYADNLERILGAGLRAAPRASKPACR